MNENDQKIGGINSSLLVYNPCQRTVFIKCCLFTVRSAEHVVLCEPWSVE